jgi:prepilin peptidase CpaA
MPINLIFPLLVAGFTLAAATIDLYCKRVPNWLTVPAAALALVSHSFAPQGHGPLLCLAGFAVGFSLLLLPWIIGGGGMGDVKLLAALGAWLGPVLILVAFGGSAIVAAGGAAAVLAFNTMQNGIASTRRKYVTAGSNGNIPLTHEEGLKRAKKRRVLPFAVPVAVSTWVLLAWMLLR